MIDVLYQVEKDLLKIINNVDRLDISKLNTLKIDYHEPFVNRIWFQYDKVHRIYLHKIYPSKSSEESLFHPHPWKSAIRIIQGNYEMGIGHSITNKIPKIDCKLILPAYTAYEMIEENGWHYVNPIKNPSYSLMVTGELNNRKMPIEPNKKFRKLYRKEIFDILDTFKKVYTVRKNLKLF